MSRRGIKRLRLARVIAVLSTAVLSTAVLSTKAWAQRQMTVEQVTSFIESSIKMHNDDRRVADFLHKIKLTNKLDARTVEQLQGMGAGPRTLAALRVLSEASATLPPPPPPAPRPAPVVIPPPSPTELAHIIEEIKDNALNYTKNLPNFICTQITRKHADLTGTETWSLVGTVQEHLSYVDHHEDYKVVMVNDRPVNNVGHNQIGGATSSGEFGTMLAEIFAPTTHTEFNWERWATLRGRRMYVFNFKVDQAFSKYSILDEPSGRTIIAGYHGLIYADRDTGIVMRIKMDCDTIPADFPIQRVSLVLDYDFTKIAGQDYVLPLKADIRSSEGRYLSWNEVEFRLYRKFGADTSITFDTPDATTPPPIPEDQLKEQPARPDSPEQPPHQGK